MFAALIRRSRISSLAAIRRRASSTSSTEHVKPPFVSTPPPPPTAAAAAAPSGSPLNGPLNFLKYTLIAAVTGVASTVGYVTYAYTLDEVDEKTRALRSYSNYAPPPDASSFKKFEGRLTSSVVTAPAKLVELYLDLRRMAEYHVRGFTEPESDKLLPDLHPQEQGVFTLVLDLNETLIYSDWNRDRGWRTFKRPGVDAFLEQLAQYYEIVVYSDQLNMYVDPVIERLDPNHCIRYKLSRTATKYVNGKHYRDLSMLNRDPAKVMYISAHAQESSLQKENCIELKSFKGEGEDTALVDMIPFLEYVARNRPADIRPVIASYEGHDIAKEFIQRSKEHQRRLLEQKKQGRPWRR